MDNFHRTSTIAYKGATIAPYGHIFSGLSRLYSCLFCLVAFVLVSTGNCFAGTNKKPKVKGTQYSSDCCNIIVDPDPDPCNPVDDIKASTLYNYNFIFDLENVDPSSITLTELAVSIQDPQEGNIEPIGLTFYNITGEGALELPYTVAGNSTVRLAAQFRFAFSQTNPVPIGDYTFTVNILGSHNSSEPSTFDASGTLTHIISPNDEECPDPSVLSIYGSNERVGTSTQPAHQAFKLYPNPSLGNMIVELDLSEDVELEIDVLTLQGQRIAHPMSSTPLITGTYRYRFDLSGLPPGIYYARIRRGTKVTVLKWAKVIH